MTSNQQHYLKLLIHKNNNNVSKHQSKYTAIKFTFQRFSYLFFAFYAFSNAVSVT